MSTNGQKRKINWQYYQAKQNFGEIYSSVLNNRPVTLGPDSLLSFNTGKGEVDNRGLMLRAYY